MKNFNELVNRALQCPPKKVAVIAAHDPEVLKSIKEAYTIGLADSILYGDEKSIISIAEEVGINLDPHQVIHQPDLEKATRMAVAAIHDGTADIVMKGKVTTQVVLKEVVHRERGLRNGNLLCHIALFEVPGFDHIMILSDAALNINPNLEQKIAMVKNAAEVAHQIGIEHPRVAIISGNEAVNPDMPSSIDAAILSKMAERGQIQGCFVDGPLSLDLAISEEAAIAKGVKGEVAGHADILIMPNIDAANTLYKTISFLFRAPLNGVIVGGKAPVIITSLADLSQAKLYSIALCVIIVTSKAGKGLPIRESTPRSVLSQNRSNKVP
jgi:phosphate butyryltransferase